MTVISSCPSLISETISTKLQTKLNNKILVSDVIQVIDTVVKAQYEAEWLMTVKLYMMMDPTA